MSMKEFKANLRKEFAKDWEKNYKVQELVDRGYQRKTCTKCGNNYWTLDQDRDFCMDSTCAGYTFIGASPTTKTLDYIDTYKAVKKYFNSKGLTSVDRYPVVARWLSDLYFTVASINDFQPYVVNGEVAPPANPLIVFQPCLRFPDIQNVGVSGRHNTSFIMIGQHAFNSKETGEFYWKDQAIAHDIECLEQALGIKQELLDFREDVWAGGGNFGPSIEYFSKGLELGNCVFMQYQQLEGGNYKELATKVIDMGAGLERFNWITTGTPTVYDTVYGPVIEKMKKVANVKIDHDLYKNYAKLAGSLDVDEVDDMEAAKEEVAKELGMTSQDLYSKIVPLQATYAIADHLKTILYAVTDGMLPSNAGGGYNLRLLLRRSFAFNEEHNLNLDFYDIVKGHAAYLKPMDPLLSSQLDLVTNVISEEQKKYKATIEKGKKKVESRILKLKKESKQFSTKELKTLYESDGITPENVQDIGRKNEYNIIIPKDYYDLEDEHQTKKEKLKLSFNIDNYPHTSLMFYEEQKTYKFIAKVVGVEPPYVILDKTYFYPEGGGQASDSGTIDGKKMEYAFKESNVVLHEVEDADKFKVNQEVECQVNEERRLSITRHHSAAHLTNAAARTVLGSHIWQAGAYKDEDKAHLDVTHYKKISDEELKQIEKLVNKWISENIAAKIEVMKKDIAEKEHGFRLYQGGAVPGKELRVLDIPEIEVEACGGTHVESTGDIGFYKILKRENVQDGVERIVYACSLAALKHIHQKEETLKKTSELIGVQEDMVAEGVAKIFNQWKDYRKKVEKMQGQLAESLAESLVEEIKQADLMQKYLDMNIDLVSTITKKLTEANPKAKIIFGCPSFDKQGIELDSSDLIVAYGEDAATAEDNANTKLQSILKTVKGKGGGQKNFARARIENKEELIKFLNP